MSNQTNEAELEKLKQELIDVQRECRELKIDNAEFLRQFEFCNILLPACEQVVFAVRDKKGDFWIKNALENYDMQLKSAQEVKVAHELPVEERWRDEKRDIAKRCGYPTYEPWAAADLLRKERDDLYERLRRKDRECNVLRREIAGEREHVRSYVSEMNRQAWENYIKDPEAKAAGWRCLTYNCIHTLKAEVKRLKEQITLALDTAKGTNPEVMPTLFNVEEILAIDHKLKQVELQKAKELINEANRST